MEAKPVSDTKPIKGKGHQAVVKETLDQATLDAVLASNLICPNCKASLKVPKSMTGTVLSRCGGCGWVREESKYQNVKHLNTAQNKSGFIMKKRNGRNVV